MKSAARRTYRQTARAEAAERTRRNIMQAAVDVWRDATADDLTLADVASRAGVTVQTVLRKFGSRDGLVDACIEAKASGVEPMRDAVAVGDVEGALDTLIAHYEADGAAALRGLELEHKSEVAGRIVAHGRAYHRKWCARVFAPWLPRRGSRRYETRLDAFVVATDLYVWKILRCDGGRSPEQARAAMAALIEGLTALA